MSGQFCSASYPEFPVDAGEVGLHGLGAELKICCDLGVGGAARGEECYALFGGGQVLVCGVGKAAPLGLGEVDPAAGAQAGEHGYRLVQCPCCVPSVAETPLDGAQDQETASEFEGQAEVPGVAECGGRRGECR